MPRISCLSEEVARRIAAGEVVERPASVVKELIENALDARASKISVICENGGTGLLDVRDNGIGMSPEDLVLAPMNFSTSKISRLEDLMHITSYGFRGEALASISAVSRMLITTSDNDSGEGWSLDLSDQAGIKPVPSPRERGTTVQVRNLFYNTPARKKFLKSKTTEKRRILETILSYAMIHHDIEIHYICDGNHVLDFLPASSWKDRVACVLGRSCMKHMVELKAMDSRIRIEGFISLPTFTRGNRSYQFLYVNGRLVREKTIIHAVSDAYRNVVPEKRFPVVVLSLNVPPEEVDVNVHPSKLEVRIRDEHAVHEAVRTAIKEFLSGRSESSLEVSYDRKSIARGGADEDISGAMLPENPTGFLMGEQVLREDGEYGGGAGSEGSNIIPLQGRIRSAFESYMQRQLERSDSTLHLSLQIPEEDSSQSEKDGMIIARKDLGEETLYWQFNNTYIFIQVHGGLVIIDQHAAHERIIFEVSKRNLEKATLGSQQLLFPIHLELSLSELEIYRSYSDIFEKLGFIIEPFGGKSILVKGYPQGLKNWEEGRLLTQIFDDIIHENAPGNTHIDKILASFACRSAVKAGKKLRPIEMKLLADQLFALENPYSCPHGRPTIQRISLSQIEKWFLRR